MMVSISMFAQLLAVSAQYKKKSWPLKLKEGLITLFFLRPAVDAYRVSTNHKDDDSVVDVLSEIILNKAAELAFELIPGCVLQLYV